MFEDLSVRITENLCKKEIIPREDEELYRYGFNMGLTMLLNLISTVLIGFLFSMIFYSIAFLVLYIPLRSYAGGYHAKTPTRCYFVSLLIIAAVLAFIKFSAGSYILYGAVLMLSSAVCFFLSPVEDANKPLDKDEYKVYRKRSLYILLAEFLMWIFLAAILHKCAAVISMAVFTEAILLILGKIKNAKNKT